ncbi:MAG: trypsin-like peptidase domain-containing protein [Leadbetterella sp.]|nr:trypsin-like peptidase domain-containing protein [Leadbetterella sp.]
MKSVSLTLLFFFNVLFCFAQVEHVSYYTEDFELCAPQAAKYLVKYKTDQNSKLVDKIKVYRASGELSADWFSNAVDKVNPYESPINGEYKSYYKDGTVYQKTMYKNNVQDGYDFEYFDNGKIKISRNYKNGILDGDYKQYDRESNLLSAENFVNGTGTLIGYYENNNKEATIRMVNGKKEGLFNLFTENGKLSSQGTFKNDSLDGPFIQYFDDGERIKKITSYTRDSITAIRFECNDYQKCKVIIENDFSAPRISQSEWSLSNYENAETIKEGLFINGKNKSAKLGNTDIDLNIPWIEYEDFTIEAEFIIKDTNTEYGLYWNENESENSYNGFVINTLNKGYEIENFDGTIFLKNKKGVSDVIKLGVNQKNTLSISKKGVDVYYSVNGIIIEKEVYKDFKFNGKRFSIYIAPKDLKLSSKIVATKYIFRDDWSYEAVKEVAEDVSKSNSYSYSGNGSGFYLNGDGYIATNYHVVENSKELEVETIVNGEVETFKAEVVKVDKQIDLAVIKIVDPKFKKFQDLPYNFNVELRPLGTSVYILGYPFSSVLSREVKYTNGAISANAGIKDEVATYQISAPVQPGNSGGPVFDDQGNLVAVVVATLDKEIFSQAENVNFAIKTPYLKSLIDILPEKISLPHSTVLAGKPMIDQISVMKKYVVKISTKE